MRSLPTSQVTPTIILPIGATMYSFGIIIEDGQGTRKQVGIAVKLLFKICIKMGGELFPFKRPTPQLKNFNLSGYSSAKNDNPILSCRQGSRFRRLAGEVQSIAKTSHSPRVRAREYYIKVAQTILCDLCHSIFGQRKRNLVQNLDKNVTTCHFLSPFEFVTR